MSDTGATGGSGIIGRIDTLLGQSSGLRLQVVGYALSGVLEGLSVATLVPVLRALIAGEIHEALWWIVVGLVAFIGSGAALLVTARRGHRIGVFNVSEGLARLLANHTARLPLGWFTAERAGQFSMRVADTQSVGNFPAQVLEQTTRALTTPATVVVVAAFIDWRLALAFLVCVPAGIGCYRWIQKVQAPARAAEADALDEVAGRVLEFAHAQPVLRASGTGAQGLARLEASLAADRRTTLRTLDETGRPMLAYTAVVHIGVVVVTVLAAWMALAGWIDPPAAVAILVLVLRFSEPLALVGPYGTGIQLAATGLANIAEIVRTPTLPEPEVPQHPVDTGVRFEDVRFGYTPEHPVLEGFSLDLRPGTVTALVGPSGAGKSTVVRLAARFWDVDTGAVTMGGTDVRDVATADLMAHISMVFQHVYLFDDTIFENVRIARPEATDEEIQAAARAARLDEVVQRLPRGWDTTVGEGGDRLSGGERQRVSIARAILGDAPVLLLDEVTAALDAENEAAVTQAIAEAARDKTVLIIAHRLSTIASADRIAFLEGGHVVESGAHEELLALGGRYADFWATRSAATRWQLGG